MSLVGPLRRFAALQQVGSYLGYGVGVRQAFANRSLSGELRALTRPDWIVETDPEWSTALGK